MSTHTTTKTGIELVAEERRRQVEQEGWTAEHDEQHEKFELTLAAISYATAVSDPDEDAHKTRKPRPCYDWPWSQAAWKPSTNPVRNLVKSAALITAEIDRLLKLGIKP